MGIVLGIPQKIPLLWRAGALVEDSSSRFTGEDLWGTGNAGGSSLLSLLGRGSVGLGEGSDFVEGSPSLLVGWGRAGVWGLRLGGEVIWPLYFEGLCGISRGVPGVSRVCSSRGQRTVRYDRDYFEEGAQSSGFGEQLSTHPQWSCGTGASESHRTRGSHGV